jgi:hypothetical protein
MNPDMPRARRLRPAVAQRPWAALQAALSRALAIAAAACALAACGPGLGGTGTGATQDALVAYGARDVPVCQAEFADLLGCAPLSAGAAPLPASDARFFAEATPASRVLLELDAQVAELRLRCRNLVFIGSFGRVGNDAPRYFGNLIEGGSRSSLATLLVQRSAGGVSVTLVDSLGFSVFGPQELAPVAGVTAEAACN